MKRKTQLILRLILLSASFLLLLGLAVLAIGGGWIPGSRGSAGTLEFTEEFDAVSSIDAAMEHCSIEVEPYDGDRVIASFYRRGLVRAQPPVLSAEEGRLQILETGGASSWLGAARLLLQVPQDSVLSYTLRTSSGSIRLDAPSCHAELHTRSGSVKVRRGGGTLEAETVSGSVKVWEPFHSLRLQTSSGSIKAAAGGETEEVSLTSSSGSIKLCLEGTDGYELQYHTAGGSVKDEYLDLSYPKSGSVTRGGGIPRIRAESRSGSIKLTDWQD